MKNEADITSTINPDGSILESNIEKKMPEKILKKTIVADTNMVEE